MCPETNSGLLDYEKQKDAYSTGAAFLLFTFGAPTPKDFASIQHVTTFVCRNITAGSRSRVAPLRVAPRDVAWTVTAIACAPRNPPEVVGAEEFSVRQMWELPRPSLVQRTSRATLVLGLTWAVVAMPLTTWLALRERPAGPPPSPPARELSVMERTAVRYGAQSLATTPVSLSSTVISASARLDVEQITDAAHAVSYGQVRSGSQSAELLVVGDCVMLRGESAFWATVGVPISDPGWIEVGDRLGTILFPLSDALASLDPMPDSRVDTPAPAAEKMTFHNGNVVAQFTESGIVELTVGERRAKLAQAPGDAVSHIAAAASTPVPAAKLIGTPGSLTVSATPDPALPPAPAAEPGRGK